jgi:hypothetical protein
MIELKISNTILLLFLMTTLFLFSQEDDMGTTYLKTIKISPIKYFINFIITINISRVQALNSQ